MNHNRNKIFVAVITVLVAGLSLALTMLQMVMSISPEIGSVSWNL